MNSSSVTEAVNSGHLCRDRYSAGGQCTTQADYQYSEIRLHTFHQTHPKSDTILQDSCHGRRGRRFSMDLLSPSSLCAPFALTSRSVNGPWQVFELQCSCTHRTTPRLRLVPKVQISDEVVSKGRGMRQERINTPLDP